MLPFLFQNAQMVPTNALMDSVFLGISCVMDNITAKMGLTKNTVCHSVRPNIYFPVITGWGKDKEFILWLLQISYLLIKYTI